MTISLYIWRHRSKLHSDKSIQFEIGHTVFFKTFTFSNAEKGIYDIRYMGKDEKKINITTWGICNFNAMQKAQGYTKTKHIYHVPRGVGWVGQGTKKLRKRKTKFQVLKKTRWSPWRIKLGVNFSLFITYHNWFKNSYVVNHAPEYMSFLLSFCFRFKKISIPIEGGEICSKKCSSQPY